MGGAKGKRGGVSDNSQSGFHPHAPPVTGSNDTAQPSDAVVNFDSNFIMMKKSDTTDELKQVKSNSKNWSTLIFNSFFIIILILF